MIPQKIGIILLIIILLPTIFYTAYEINSLSENEKLVDEIYQQQMNIILYSVNQYAWDLTSNWADRFNNILGQPGNQYKEKFQNLLSQNNAIDAFLLADTTISNLQFITSSDQTLIRYNKQDMLNILNQNREVLRKLYLRKLAGYTKIESFTFNVDSIGTEQSLMLMFISERYDKQPYFIGIILHVQKFINTVLIPRLNDMVRNEFIAGIFKKDDSLPIYSTEEIRSEQIKIKRNIWLFPDHFLGIRLKGKMIVDLTRPRFYRSLAFIIILDVILIIGAWIIYRNIRHEMELARMKSDFVSNVSHQLRTPLALIRMFAETLELNRISADEKKREYYKIIGQETERLTHLVNNILDFSKMEAGKKQYFFKRSNLNEIVQQTLDLYKFHLQNKGFELKTDIAYVTPLNIYADREAIIEALINLLDNAIKYCSEQKYIIVKTGIENKMAFVEVEDHGIGIPLNEQKRIFDKFYRISSGLTSITKGSGLGLTLVKYIVEAHKGTIDVESAVNQGSRFRILFPSIE